MFCWENNLKIGPLGHIMSDTTHDADRSVCVRVCASVCVRWGVDNWVFLGPRRQLDHLSFLLHIKCLFVQTSGRNQSAHGPNDLGGGFSLPVPERLVDSHETRLGRSPR